MAFDKPKTNVESIWNPIADFHSLALGFAQHKCLVSQIMPKPSSQKTCETKKFMIMGKVAHVWPTLLTMARGGQSSCQTLVTSLEEKHVFSTVLCN